MDDVNFGLRIFCLYNCGWIDVNSDEYVVKRVQPTTVNTTPKY